VASFLIHVPSFHSSKDKDGYITRAQLVESLTADGLGHSVFLECFDAIAAQYGRDGKVPTKLLMLQFESTVVAIKGGATPQEAFSKVIHGLTLSDDSQGEQVPLASLPAGRMPCSRSAICDLEAMLVDEARAQGFQGSAASNTSEARYGSMFVDVRDPNTTRTCEACGVCCGGSHGACLSTSSQTSWDTEYGRRTLSRATADKTGGMRMRQSGLFGIIDEEAHYF